MPAKFLLDHCLQRVLALQACQDLIADYERRNARDARFLVGVPEQQRQLVATDFGPLVGAVLLSALLAT